MLAYTLLGMDKEAQQDVDRAKELGIDRGKLEVTIEELKGQRQGGHIKTNDCCL